MQLTFLSTDSRLVPQAEAIVRQLQEAGYTAYFAGGCVRDALRQAPVKDIDIATSATPDEVAALFPAQSIGVGKSFGVMLVVLNGISYDVATFRTDGGYQDGRHPESITYDTAEHDAQRRDFTVNALFYDPIQQTVIDFVNGVEDLKAGILRAIGNPKQRFQEDRLRMLRAIRFATVCKWQIEPATWRAICEEAPHLMCVSYERIYIEFTRMLCEAADPGECLNLLRTSKLLRQFFRELCHLYGCLQDPHWHPEGDVWQHTVKMLQLIPAPRDPELVWAVLLHDIGKPKTLIVETKPDGSPWYRTPSHAAVGARMVEPILRRFKASNERIERITTAVRYHMQFVEIQKMRTSSLRQMLGRPTIELELALHRLDCLSSHSKLDLYEYAKEALAKFVNEPILPPPALTGKDLVAMGYHPSPVFGRLLKKAYTQQLEGATREQLLCRALDASPTPSNRAKRIAFLVDRNDVLPCPQAWESRLKHSNWQVTLIQLPGLYWEDEGDAHLTQTTDAFTPTQTGETIHFDPAKTYDKAQIVRLVTNCAGNVDYPPARTYDLLIHHASTPLSEELRALAKHLIAY